ncbi:MAG TPA: (2Fe-2S)-binding protein [Candidatus Elarobacter sp.]|jgi:isoquinoline 1-oxidoreductase alpha subunit
MKRAFALTVNGEKTSFEADPAMPLLWVLRDVLGLTGTKFGCGIAQCGACTVDVNGAAMRSCVTPVGTVETASIRTIEGLAADPAGAALQRAWVGEDVAQCRYCQSGMLIEATRLLREQPHPTDPQIDAGMAGHICRCGTYPRIRAAIRSASAKT